MNQALTLNRRMRPNRVLPELRAPLQRTFSSWRSFFSPPWNWLTLMPLAFLSWIAYGALTGNFSALIGFLLCFVSKDLYNNALPIFERARFSSCQMTTGKLLGERHSLAEIETYRTSQKDLPEHLIQFTFSEKYWPNRFSLIIDKEDAATLSEYLEARDIAAVAAIAAPVALPA